MPAQPALRVTGLRVPARGDQTDCSSSYSPQRVLCGTAAPRILLRRVKRPAHSIRFASHAHAASISAVLDDLAGMLPHVTLPRFPPVVRRLVAALQGRDEGEADGACERGLVKRKRADKHTLATRDVHKEDDVIALEVTGGRKRVYKRRQSKHPDGSFEMVQVRTRALPPAHYCHVWTPKASMVTTLRCRRHMPYRKAPAIALLSSTCITCCVVHNVSAKQLRIQATMQRPDAATCSRARRLQRAARQAVRLQEHESSGLALRRLWASFLVPQGYPDSVSPQYTEYMAWRGVQYFFGGALSLFTTRALLTSVGVKKGASASAAAINWVLKDGAGRLGRFLFARWGHQLDCELKQFRLLGDGLMEAGAVLELSTIAFPKRFLLLACTANLMKNLAAVAASSTRAPIYRTFALHNNMADVTAKGESVANLSDIFGVAAGIALSKLGLPMAATFALLSCGYLVASRKEVDSVILPYLNQVSSVPCLASDNVCVVGAQIRPTYSRCDRTCPT